jgi:hypothetical protein
VIALWGSSFFS